MHFIPNSEVGEHARLARSWTRLASSIFARNIVTNLGNVSVRPSVFREGAENSARAGALPISNGSVLT